MLVVVSQSALTVSAEFVRRWNCASGKKMLVPVFKVTLSMPTTCTWVGPAGVSTTSRCPTCAWTARATAGPSTTTGADVAVSAAVNHRPELSW